MAENTPGAPGDAHREGPGGEPALPVEHSDTPGKWAPGARAAAFRSWFLWIISLGDIPGGAAVGAVTVTMLCMGSVAFILSCLGHPVDIPAGLTSFASTAVGGYSAFGAVKAWRNGYAPAAGGAPLP